MSHLSSPSNAKLLARIRRIRGQLEGVERQLVAGEDCYAILQSATACRGALNALTRELIHDHIDHHLAQSPDAGPSAKEAALQVQSIIKSFLK